MRLLGTEHRDGVRVMGLFTFKDKEGWIHFNPKIAEPGLFLRQKVECWIRYMGPCLDQGFLAEIRGYWYPASFADVKDHEDKPIRQALYEKSRKKSLIPNIDGDYLTPRPLTGFPPIYWGTFDFTCFPEIQLNGIHVFSGGERLISVPVRRPGRRGNR